LGAGAGVAKEYQAQLEVKYPGIKIVGTYSPPYAKHFLDEENEKMVSLINQANPDILWVSLTAPKQDIWIYENLSKLNSKINIGIGGALDVAVGKFARAPIWMQNLVWNGFIDLAKNPKDYSVAILWKLLQLCHSAQTKSLGKN